MVLKLLGTIGVPGTFSGKMYSIVGLRYWPQVMPFAAVGATVPAGAFGSHAPSMTARTSRGGGRKVPVWLKTQSLSALAGTVPKVEQGGRKRQRPRTAPFGAPGSTPMVPKSRSLVAPVSGSKSTP